MKCQKQRHSRKVQQQSYGNCNITPYLCVLLIALPSFVGRCIELPVVNHTTVEEKAEQGVT
jgi:hypothetical protein